MSGQAEKGSSGRQKGCAEGEKGDAGGDGGSKGSWNAGVQGHTAPCIRKDAPGKGNPLAQPFFMLGTWTKPSASSLKSLNAFNPESHCWMCVLGKET